MAQLPDAQALGEMPVPKAPQGAAQYQPHTRMEEMPGEYLSRAGSEIQQAGAIVQQANEKQDQIAAESAINKLNEQRMNLEFDPDTGFRNIQGSAAVGEQFHKDQLQRFSDAAQSINDGLANDQQRKFFQQRAPVAALQYQGALLQHQAQQTESFNRETADSAINLQLRDMAVRPMDELNFQTGLTAINGTIEREGERRGMPAGQIEELKDKYKDAAYTTRILSVMNDNPYLAEKMLDQHLSELGPASQVHLKDEVVKNIKTVQQRDIAQSLVYGNKQPTDPGTLYPAIQNTPPLADVVKNMESGGNRYDKNGNLLTSSAGAQGEMQVMPATALNPGFGVKPAQDNSPEEKARVGRDYLGAMTARYQDPALVLAAYNAGPGQVDKWINQYGDPRTGQISSADWASKIPFSETSSYVANGLKQINAQAGNPNAPISPPTAKELKTQLPAMVDQARQAAQRMYPNDPVFADSVAMRVQTSANNIIAQQDAQQAASRDMLTRGLVGTKPDGSDKPQTIDALLSDPRMKQAWDQATPEVQLAIQERFARGEKQRTPQSQALLYQYMGKYSNDREGFANEDLTPLINQLPAGDFDKLANMQVSARNKQELAQDKAINLERAKAIALDYALKPIGIGVPDKNTPQAKKDQYDQFTGALRQELDQFQTQNKRPPNDQEIATMSKNLTATVQLKGGTWFGFGDKDIRAFQIGPDNQGNVTAKIPDAFRSGISQAMMNANGGKQPTEQQIQTAYILSLRQPPKVKK